MLKGAFMKKKTPGMGKPLYQARESSLVPLCLHPVQFLQKLRFMKHALQADLGAQNTSLQVWKQKILLVHHIRSLEDTALAKMMYLEQVRNNWPGLAKEIEDLCAKLNIENVNTTSKSKIVYAKEVKKGLQAHGRLLDED